MNETVSFLDGSPLVAFKESLVTATAFSSVYVCDKNVKFLAAARQRLEAQGAPVKGFAVAAEEAVKKVASDLNPAGLHFAFLDPYNLKALPFAIIKRLASFQRMDMLIHLSATDLQRNVDQYVREDPSRLDDVFPGWRAAVNCDGPQHDIRRQLLQHYKALIRDLDFRVAEGIEVVTGAKRQHLYWLVFAARHDLAIEFWNAIRTVSPQRSLLLQGGRNGGIQ